MARVKEFLLGTVLFIALFILPCGIVGNIENHYDLKATVIEVENDLVIVTDKSGNEWSFYGDGYEIGQSVKMKMFTSYTDDTIYDDEIIKVKPF